MEQAPETGMTTETSEGGGRDVTQFLPWLIAMGADEIVLDSPVNRFSEVAAPAEIAPARQRNLPAVPPAVPPPVAPRAAAASGDVLAEAIALAAAANDLSSLGEAWARFDNHPLKRTATRLCFLGGTGKARALILCDKPRSEEDPMGEVLSGKHQALAENMLAAIGLCGVVGKDGLEQVALANFVPWRPPGNRAIVELEGKLSVPFISRLVELLQPVAILCLGALPGQFLVGGDSAITRARGKWRNFECNGSAIPMMTTFHPETLLKSPQSKKLAWQDLQAFRDRLNPA